MASFRYYVRSAKKNKLAKIQILFTVGRGNQFYVDSQLMVLTDAWSDKTQGIKSRYSFPDDYTSDMGIDLTNKLADMRSFILKSITNLADIEMTKSRLEGIIFDFHNPTVDSVIKRETLTDFITRYVTEMESGKRLNNKKLRYSPSTTKNYKGFIKRFDDFCKSKRKRYDFDDIDLKFYDSFVAYFSGLNYSINTIGRHVKELKIIMRAARDEGLHDNRYIESQKFRVLTTEVTNIYLSESELNAIASIDLKDSKPKELARDVFLVGCYTAQRFSDYSTINSGNIRTLDNGQIVVDLIQQKTSNHVIIPARPELVAILEKYDYSLPKSYEQKVNRYMKEIAREAGIIKPIEINYIEKGVKKSKVVEKCNLVTTHTARRSGATNMYLAKIPTIAIMKITGHKTEREFMKYIMITAEESAMELIDHPYFGGYKS